MACYVPCTMGVNTMRFSMSRLVCPSVLWLNRALRLWYYLHSISPCQDIVPSGTCTIGLLCMFTLLTNTTCIQSMNLWEQIENGASLPNYISWFRSVYVFFNNYVCKYLLYMSYFKLSHIRADQKAVEKRPLRFAIKIHTQFYENKPIFVDDSFQW